MVKLSRKFYQNAYRHNAKSLSSAGIMGRLYQSLKKFESYREDIVFNLLPGGIRMLDIGCGEGNLIFKSVGKYSQLYGIEIAPVRLKKANFIKNRQLQVNRKKIHFLSLDMDEKLPFRGEFFDCITLVATLEHFFDPYHVIKEIKRILNRKGTLIIQVPNLGFLPRRISVLFGYLPLTSENESGWDGGHLHYFTVSSLVSFLKENGFKTDVITCSGVFSGIRSRYVSLLGADIIIRAVKT